MADAAGWMWALRWPLAVALALLAVVLRALGGALVAWATAGPWVLSLAPAALAAAGAVIGAVLDD